MKALAAVADDIDAYVLLDVVKLSDTITVGGRLHQREDRRATQISASINLGLNMNGKFGPGT